MNEILKSLYDRKSVRVFTEEEIAEEDKKNILYAAMQAPSAGCQLLYTILDMTDQEKKDRLAELCDHQLFMAKAKMMLVFCADCRKWLSFYEEERGNGGGKSGNRFLLYRRCDGECGRSKKAFAASEVCISCLSACFWVSDKAAEGTEEAGAVPIIGYRL